MNLVKPRTDDSAHGARPRDDWWWQSVTPYMFQSARELFEAAREASRDAERIRRQLVAMEHTAEGMGGPGLEGRVCNASSPDKMASRIAALVDREEMLRRRQAEDYAIIELANRVLYGTECDSGLYALAGWRAEALYHHYINGETWAVCGRLLGYSEQYVWREAQAALEICDAYGLMSVMRGMGDAEDQA